jgi:hypothetical protein
MKKIKKGISTQIPCPFCHRFIEKKGAYEFTLKFMLNILDYYHKNKMNSQNDDQNVTNEKVPMYQIFNHYNKPNQDIAKLIEQSNSDEDAKGKYLISKLKTNIIISIFLYRTRNCASDPAPKSPLHRQSPIL